MEKKLIGFGALSGALAGLVTFVFARLLAEPLIQKAIDYEAARDDAQHALDAAAGTHVVHEGHEMFSRTIQGDVGIGVGLVLFGVAMGALVAVAYAVCIGRTGRIGYRPLALLVAASGFVAFYLVPFAKYPANPPAIGAEETIRTRGALYLLVVACSVLFLFLAVYVGQRVAARLGNWNAAVVCGLGYLAVMAVLFLVLPDQASETPQPLTDEQGGIVFPGFPADVLAQFRAYSVAAQVLLWGLIGLVFAPLAERVMDPGAARRPADTARARQPV